jgi:hypothetical protein
MQKNRLGLDDDLDDVELLQDIEAAFGLRFTDTERGNMNTVGDIARVLADRMPAGAATQVQCATAMAFYRVRRALAAATATDMNLRPETVLRDVTPLSPRRLLAHLSSETGLRMPRQRLSVYGWSGLAVLALGVLSSNLAAHGAFLWTIPVAVVAAGSLLLHRDPGRLPDDCRTLGGLARKVAALNLGSLLAQGAAGRPQDIWAALVEVCTQHTGLPKADIRPDTLLLHKQMKSA